MVLDTGYREVCCLSVEVNEFMHAQKIFEIKHLTKAKFLYAHITALQTVCIRLMETPVMFI